MNAFAIALADSEQKKLEYGYDFSPGDLVIVIKNQNPKEKVRRKGHIVWVGKIFVCIWIESRCAPMRYGWRECFFYHDIYNGNVTLEKRGGKTKVIEK